MSVYGKRSNSLVGCYVQKMFSENRGDVVLPVEVACGLVHEGATGGAIGVGTWVTQAEFKDIKVTRGDKVLFASDFAEGTKGWRLLSGDWKAQDGVLRQNSMADNVRAVTGDKSWSDYTYSLKARKLGGAEGFLILFRVQNDHEKAWWNLGGWGNVRHAIELGGVIGNEVPGRIETGRWYDIRIELKGANIQCYLDGKLIHDLNYPSVKSLYASASRAKATSEVILKVVNVTPAEQTAAIKLQGVGEIDGPGTLTVLASANAADENSLEHPTKVTPKTQTIAIPGPSFRHTLPANSVSVLRVKTR